MAEANLGQLAEQRVMLGLARKQLEQRKGPTSSLPFSQVSPTFTGQE